MNVELVELAEIISEENRKYTNDESFGQLKWSIKEHGLIEPPVLLKLTKPEKGYRVVAGRRRIAALRELNKEQCGVQTVSVDCAVIDADDPCDDEEIALSENVNRLDMHPLDEAVLFSRMALNGATIGYIAERYARSKSAIYKRLRLAGLVDELKGMFRDGRIDMVDVAVLAEFPEEDQKDFFKQYGEKETINKFTAFDFVRKKQRFAVRKSMKKICDGCRKRTHNEGNELFGEAEHLDDVCLDGECYRLKWYEMIGKALAKKHRESGITDGKIYFCNGIPELLYKKASKVRFAIGKTDIEFDVLRDKDYEFKSQFGDSKKKTSCCWKIMENDHSGITVSRVEYKKKQPAEKPGEKSRTEDGGKVERYGKGVLEAVAADRFPDSTAEELAEKLGESNVSHYNFEALVKDKIFERVVAKRIEDEKTGREPPRNYFTMFLLRAEEMAMGDDTFVEKDFSAQQKKWQKDILRGGTLKQIDAGLSEETQMLFHFLLLSVGLYYDMPDVDDLEMYKTKKYRNDFLDYSGLSVDEYKALYIETAKEAAAEALKPKKKKAPLKKKRPAAEAEVSKEDDDPFTPESDSDMENEDADESEDDPF
jgi:ParB family chromosome partitioning protein